MNTDVTSFRTVSFPHYFLNATGRLAEQLKTREWIVARITSLTERVVDSNVRSGLCKFDIMLTYLLCRRTLLPTLMALVTAQSTIFWKLRTGRNLEVLLRNAARARLSLPLQKRLRAHLGNDQSAHLLLIRFSLAFPRQNLWELHDHQLLICSQSEHARILHQQDPRHCLDFWLKQPQNLSLSPPTYQPQLMANLRFH